MTHSLEDLKAGKLIGTKTLKLACDLKEFPEEILNLSESLEVLDLSDNQLSELPESIIRLKNLKTIFCARNHFKVFPKILREMPELSMIGFKSNRIEEVPENAFPPKLRWLILTDNKIEILPKSIGACHLLQKCALAGNRLEELPPEMAACKNLELLRVSANRLRWIPYWLFSLPKLSWVAFGGNPAAHPIPVNTDFASHSWKDFRVKELLGEGASGLISKAEWLTEEQEVALKIFKGDVTSDGLAEDEMEVSIAAGAHENLIPILGKIKDHPEEKNGLLMELIGPEYINLGNPPSMESCTRDVFDEEIAFKADDLFKIASSIASVSARLHSKGINHGDLYAHNILLNEKSDCLFGDFGAASCYDVNSILAPNVERVEVRAFACLLEDVLGLIPKQDLKNSLQEKWENLIALCSHLEVQERPSFFEILDELKTFDAA